MNALRTAAWRLLALFRRRRLEEDLAAEMQAHLDLLVEENLRRGMDREEARSAALRAFGGVEQAKEAWRDQRNMPLAETLVLDVRIAGRMLRRSPGFTAVAILTFALGIGANTAIFTVVQEAALNPLPVKSTERLVWLANAFPGAPVGVLFNLHYKVWHEQSRSFERMAAYTTSRLTLTGAGLAARLPAGRVSAQFFSMLGVAPALGRDFAAREEQPSAARVTILGHELWRNRFGGDPSIVGRALTLDGEPYEVVGVLPQSFRFLDHLSADLFIPYLLPGSDMKSGVRFEPVNALAWLKPGVTPRQAEAELAAILERSKNDYPLRMFSFSGEQPRPHVVTPAEWRAAATGLAPLVLAAAVGLVLLMACANVANLHVARFLDREREMAIRSALGASRMRLVRQLLTESVLLATLGGAAGLALAFWGVRALRVLAPESLAYVRNVEPNGTTLLFTAAIALGSGVLSGLFPAMTGTRRDVDHALKQGARRHTAGRATRRSHGALSVAAIALAMVLLTGSGLLIRSFLRLTAERFGFEPQNLLTLRISLPASRYGSPGAQRGAAERLLREVHSLPGVAFVSISDLAPLQPPGSYSFEVEGQPITPGKSPMTRVFSVSSDYFRAMEIPVLAGREFSDRDGVGAPPVAIVSDTLQRRVWGGERAIGKRIRTRSDVWLTVVGVVGDTRLPRSSGPPDAVVYQPFAQPDSSAMMAARTLEENQGHAGTRQWLEAVANLTVSIRTVVPPGSLASAVRARVAAIDADIPAFDLATMEERLARTVEKDRFNMTLLGSFAAMALLLATVGVYGVTDYGVRRRTQEIGVRVALGASRERILRMVLLETARAALLGLALGGVAAFFVTGLLKALLFGVGVRDPLALVTAAAIVLLVSLTAGYIPSRRATRIDPALALRHE